MNPGNLGPIIIMTAAAVTALLVAIYVYHRRESAGSTIFVAVMLATGFWAFSSVAEYIVIPVADKIRWSQVAYLGIVCLGPLWFLFSAEYTRRTAWLSPSRIRLLGVFPLIVLGLVATNGLHSLIWSEIVPASADPGARLIYHHGIAFWLNTVYQGEAFLATEDQFKEIYHRDVKLITT